MMAIKDKKEEKGKNEFIAASVSDSLTSQYTDYYTNSAQQLNLTDIDSIVEQTILGPIVNKIAGSMFNNPYTITTGDDQMDELCGLVNKKFIIDHRKLSAVEALSFGNSFDFINWTKDEKNIISFEEMSILDVKPQVSDEEGFIALEYGDMVIERPDFCHVAFNRKKGQLFGRSIFLPCISVLNILLTGVTSVGIGLHKFANPIIQWVIDKGVNAQGAPIKVTQDDYNDLRLQLSRLAMGEDLVTSKTVEQVIKNLDSGGWKFEESLKFVNEMFHVIVGVPAMLMGYGGTNKEISKTLMKVYYETLANYEISYGSQYIRDVWRPLCENNGKEEVDIQIAWPEHELEERSSKWGWVGPMHGQGLINDEMARIEMNQPKIMPEMSPESQKAGNNKTVAKSAVDEEMKNKL